MYGCASWQVINARNWALRRRQEKQRSLVNLLQFLQARTIPFSKIIEHQQRYDIGLRTSTEVGFYGLAQIVLTCTNSQFFGTVGALQKFLQGTSHQVSPLFISWIPPWSGASSSHKRAIITATNDGWGNVYVVLYIKQNRPLSTLFLYHSVMTWEELFDFWPEIPFAQVLSTWLLNLCPHFNLLSI